jgi:hypothetical protein
VQVKILWWRTTPERIFHVKNLRDLFYNLKINLKHLVIW